MRLGCDVPYFEDPDDIRTFAHAAEEIGLITSAFPSMSRRRLTEYPALFSYRRSWHESFTMLTFLAAVTTTIEVSSAMALVTLRDPVLVAKQAAEVDLLSRGRLRLAVSVGSNREEQRALGVDPATRGRRIEEMVPLLRRCGPKTRSRITVRRSTSTRSASTRGPRGDPGLDGWRRLRVSGSPWRSLDETGGAARRRLQADGSHGRRRRPSDRLRTTSPGARRRAGTHDRHRGAAPDPAHAA